MQKIANAGFGFIEAENNQVHIYGYLIINAWYNYPHNIMQQHCYRNPEESQCFQEEVIRRDVTNKPKQS